MKQSVQVSILGQQFNLRSEASPEQVQRVARFAEEQIARVTASGRAVDSLQAAILALLNVSAAHLDGDAGASLSVDAERLQHLADKLEKALGH